MFNLFNPAILPTHSPKISLVSTLDRSAVADEENLSAEPYLMIISTSMVKEKYSIMAKSVSRSPVESKSKINA